MPLQVIGKTYTQICRPGLEPLPNKGYWILVKSPKKIITVGPWSKSVEKWTIKTELANSGQKESSYSHVSLGQCYNNLLFPDYFELTKCNRTRAKHNYMPYEKFAILNCYKYSIFVWIVNVWNNLPTDVVPADFISQQVKDYFIWILIYTVVK